MIITGFIDTKTVTYNIDIVIYKSTLILEMLIWWILNSSALLTLKGLFYELYGNTLGFIIYAVIR